MIMAKTLMNEKNPASILHDLPKVYLFLFAPLCC